MIDVNSFKTGMTIVYEGNLFQILEFQHVKPGKGAAFVRTKLKNLRTGANIEITFNSSIKVPTAHIDKHKMQFLYGTGDTYNFMNMETYEQLDLSASSLGDDAKYLKEGLEVDITFYEGEMLGISLPEKIVYTITSCEPGIKGNTATSANKEAVLENGLTVRVPLFVNEGENIIVSTSTGKYDSRA